MVKNPPNILDLDGQPIYCVFVKWCITWIFNKIVKFFYIDYSFLKKYYFLYDILKSSKFLISERGFPTNKA